MINRLIILIIISAVLVGCASGTVYESAPLSVEGAQATASAAAINANTIAGQATMQAAQETAVSINATATANTISTRAAATATVRAIGTSDSLNTAGTRQAMQFEATGHAISANATGTAVAALAQAEAILIAGEATRDANVRAAEVQAMQQAKAFTIVKITVWLLVGFGVAVFFVMVGYRLYNLSRPQQIQDSNGNVQTALPYGQFQVLAPRRVEAPALPEITMTRPQPQQLPQLNNGHVLIVGVTGDGKSMTLRELVDQRSNVVVLDPHARPGAWGNARVIGGGSDYDAIGNYMRWMKDELIRRSEQRANHTNRGELHFEPLTVATEEMPAIMSELGGEARFTWAKWMREGRKFGLFMEVVTQSTRVKSLGIEGEGDLLENFKYVIELASSARANYPELVEGMQRPAIIRSGNKPPIPIIIPYDPRKDPERPEFIPHYLGDGIAPQQPQQPLFIAPDVQGLETDWGTVTPQQIAEILRLKGGGVSNASIERGVFNQEKAGGAAYYKVKAVLDKFYKNTVGA